MLKNAIFVIMGLIVIGLGIFWASGHSSSKSQAVYEKFAKDLGEGKLEAAYAVLHPNAQRGIPFARFKAAFGRMQPVVTVTMDKESTNDKISGKTFSTEGCESEYTMKVVDYMGKIMVTRFNFKPYCGY